MRLALTRKVQFYGSIFSYNLKKESNVSIVLLLGDLLVEVSNVDIAFLISDFHVTQVLLEVNLDHLLSDSAPKLAGVDINFHFGFFVAPAEFVDV